MIHPHLPRLALSVRQPWAHCIITLGKPVENRDWSTKVRGEICVHAAKGMTEDEWESCFLTARDVAAVTPFPEGTIFPGKKALPRGGIVGTVEIVDVVTSMENPWFFGKYGFVLANPKPVDFIVVKGALSFFDWRKNLEA